MNPYPSVTALLTCHPETPAGAVRGIEARVSWMKAGTLAFAYAMEGDMSRLRIPEARPSGAADRLWEHTCFEAFVSATDRPGYYELNFSPSGEWAVYLFDRYRERSPLAEEVPAPRIDFRASGDRVELDAIVGPGRWRALSPDAKLRLALSAVVEDERTMLSYWALRHPSGKADFHHPAGFALDLDPPGETIRDRHDKK